MIWEQAMEIQLNCFKVLQMNALESMVSPMVQRLTYTVDSFGEH